MLNHFTSILSTSLLHSVGIISDFSPLVTYCICITIFNFNILTNIFITQSQISEFVSSLDSVLQYQIHCIINNNYISKGIWLSPLAPWYFLHITFNFFPPLGIVYSQKELFKKHSGNNIIPQPWYY